MNRNRKSHVQLQEQKQIEKLKKKRFSARKFSCTNTFKSVNKLSAYNGNYKPFPILC